WALAHLHSASSSTVLLPLHSFPTRRSSDLGTVPPHPALRADFSQGRGEPPLPVQLERISSRSSLLPPGATSPASSAHRRRRHARSEEHTSELQSRFDLVCRLLLEKKKRTE